MLTENKPQIHPSKQAVSVTIVKCSEEKLDLIYDFCDIFFSTKNKF